MDHYALPLPHFGQRVPGGDGRGYSPDHEYVGQALQQWNLMPVNCWAWSVPFQLRFFVFQSLDTSYMVL